MAATIAIRRAALQVKVRRQRQLTRKRLAETEGRQVALVMQSRLADIQTTLDFVTAAIRLAAPPFGATLISPQLPTANRYFGAFHLVPSRQKPDGRRKPTAKRLATRRPRRSSSSGIWY